MNNKVLNVAMKLDASSALSEVDKLDKRIKESFAWSKQMKGGIEGSTGMDDMVANGKKLEKALNSTYKNMKRLDKAMEGGSFREQAKYSNKLKESLEDLDNSYKGLRKQLGVSKGGFEDVNNAIMEQIRNTKKAQQEMSGYYSKGLKQRRGYASAIGKATSSKYQSETGSAQVYGAYKKAKQEQQEIANTLKNISKREDSINKKIRNRNQGLNKVVQESEKYSEVIAGEIVPANIKNTKRIEEARNKSKQLNKEIDERVQEKRELLNLAVKNGATSEQIKAIHRSILNLEQERTQKEQHIADEIKKEKNQTKGLSKNFVRARKVTKSLNNVLGIFVKKSNQAAQSQSRLGIKTQKASKEIIRQGGRTSGLIRTFSRWRNRLLVVSFALAGLVRGLQKATQFAIEARKQFIALRKVSENLGMSTTKVNNAARSLAADGLVSLKEASQSIKALVATGAPLKTVINNLNAMKDAAIANGRAGYTVGQNLVAYSRGIKQMRSQLADAAGVMRNISQILRDHPDLVGKYGKATALLKGYTEEAQRFAGTTEEMLETLPGIMQAVKGQFKLLSTEVGQSLAGFSEKFVKYVLKKIKQVREVFNKREGGLHAWAVSFGEQAIELSKIIEGFMPELLKFGKTIGGVAAALMEAVNTVSGWIEKVGPFISSIGSVAAKLYVAKTAAFVFGSILFGLSTKIKSVIVSLNTLRTSAVMSEAAIAKLGAAMNLAVPIITAVTAVVGYAYINSMQKARQEQAELNKEIKETNQAWDKLKSGALDIAESLNKISQNMGKTTNKKDIMGMVESYMKLGKNINKAKNEIGTLKNSLEFYKDMPEPGLMDKIFLPEELVSLRGKNISELQSKINSKKKELNDLSAQEVSYSDKIIKLSEKINDEYDLQLAKVIDRNGELKNGFRFINMHKGAVESVLEFTKKELVDWVSINKELSKVLTGIQQINEEIQRMSGEAEKTLTKIKRDIEEIKFSDKYSEIIGFQREYNETVSEYDKNLDKLIGKRTKLENKYKQGTEAMRGYLKTVKDVFIGGSTAAKEMTKAFTAPMDTLIEKSNLSKDAFKNTVSNIVRGVYTVEDAMSALKETTGKKEFFDESKVKSYLNLLKTYSEIQSNINDSVDLFSKVTDTAMERRNKQMENFFSKWKQNIEEMKQGYKTDIKGIESEIDSREQSISTLEEKIGVLKEQERITKSAENRIQIQKLRLKYNERINKQQKDFNKSIMETNHEIDNVTRDMKSVSQSVAGIKWDSFKDDIVGSKDSIGEIESKIGNVEGKVDKARKAYKEVKTEIRGVKVKQGEVGKELLEQERIKKNTLDSTKSKLKALKVIKRYLREIGVSQEHIKELEGAKENMIGTLNEQQQKEIKLMKIRNEKERKRIEYYKQFIDIKKKGMTGKGFFSSAFNMFTREGGFQVLGAAESQAEKAKSKLDKKRSQIKGVKEGTSKYKKLNEEINKQMKLYNNALDSKQNFWNKSNDIMRNAISQSVDLLSNYVKQWAQHHRELDKERASWNAKQQYYVEEGLQTQKEYAKKQDKFQKYQEKRREIQQQKRIAAMWQGVEQMAMAAGKKLLIKGLSEVMGLAPWTSIALGATLLTAGASISLSDVGSHAEKVGALQGEMEAKKSTGGYGNAFESPSTGGSSTDTGTGGSTAGSTVNAEPQTININPSIDFTGETLLLTPHGDVEEVGNALSNTIVNEVKDAVETGRLDL